MNLTLLKRKKIKRYNYRVLRGSLRWHANCFALGTTIQMEKKMKHLEQKKTPISAKAKKALNSKELKFIQGGFPQRAYVPEEDRNYSTEGLR